MQRMWRNRLTTIGAVAAGIFVTMACSSSGDVVPPELPPGYVDPGKTDASTSTGSSGGFLPGTPDGGTSSGTEACVSTSKSALTFQLDILFLVDTTGSMLANGKWDSQTKALSAFFTDPRAEGIGVGIKFFPDFEGAYPICDDNVYAVPDVSISPLSQVHAGMLNVAMSQRSPLGGTPLGSAVQGGLRFASTWKKQNPEHNVVLVLATDGLPDDTCKFTPPGRVANTISAVSAEVKSAYEASPPVPTYVIGVGSELAPLNDVANAGGTGQAVFIDTTKDVASQMVAAFDAIRRKELTCEYAIPVPSGSSQIDYTKVNIRFVDELGYADFLYVASPENCNKTNYGWFYDNPATPSRIILCEPFCSEVKASRTGKIDVAYGCQRNEIVIK
jgi:hypothetical protein